MNHELLDFVRRSEQAERSGDAHAALEWHRSVPMFRSNRHGALMAQLSLVGEDRLPEWAWARWITYQAIRCESGATGAIAKTLLPILVGAVHEDLAKDCYDNHGDPARIAARVYGESWAFHQVAAHGTDMVETFIRDHARGRLAEHADLARRWVGAPMSGYLLGASLPGARLSVVDLATGDHVEVLDLGARSVAADGWVIGRLVPSGVGALSMFDMTPLAVSEDQARSVATTSDGWLRLEGRLFLREDFELLGDVHVLDLVRFATSPTDLPRVMTDLREGRDEIARAAYRILRSALAGDLPAEDQAFIAAAVLQPGVQDDLWRKLVRAGHPEPWVSWAARTPSPARGHLLALAEAARRTA